MANLVPIDVARLARYLEGTAPALLDRYFNSGDFTGGRFERFAGGGDRSETVNHLTSDDILAVSLLGVRIPGRAALEVLESKAPELNALLSQIPAEVDLWEVPEVTVGPDSAADQLWRRLVDLPGAGWVTAGKLLARKRPRLIPVYDRVVQTAMARADTEWWRPLRIVLRENPGLIVQLEGLRDQTGLGSEVSLLRVLDVCVWMNEYGQPEPVADAEA